MNCICEDVIIKGLCMSLYGDMFLTHDPNPNPNR